MCGMCHGPDGGGLAPLYPPTRDSSFVKEASDSTLRTVILDGMSGPIEVNGVQYETLMPPTEGLTDADCTKIITYLRSIN